MNSDLIQFLTEQGYPNAIIKLIDHNIKTLDELKRLTIPELTKSLPATKLWGALNSPVGQASPASNSTNASSNFSSYHFPSSSTSSYSSPSSSSSYSPSSTRPSSHTSSSSSHTSSHSSFHTSSHSSSGSSSSFPTNDLTPEEYERVYEMRYVDIYKSWRIPYNSTLKQIKERYKELQLQHHPDRKGGDSEKAAKINSHFKILGDERLKKEYDKNLKLSYLFSGDQETYSTDTSFDDMASDTIFQYNQQFREEKEQFTKKMEEIKRLKEEYEMKEKIANEEKERMKREEEEQTRIMKEKIQRKKDEELERMRQEAERIMKQRIWEMQEEEQRRKREEKRIQIETEYSTQLVKELEGSTKTWTNNTNTKTIVILRSVSTQKFLCESGFKHLFHNNNSLYYLHFSTFPPMIFLRMNKNYKPYLTFSLKKGEETLDNSFGCDNQARFFVVVDGFVYGTNGNNNNGTLVRIRASNDKYLVADGNKLRVAHLDMSYHQNFLFELCLFQYGAQPTPYSIQTEPTQEVSMPSPPSSMSFPPPTTHHGISMSSQTHSNHSHSWGTHPEVQPFPQAQPLPHPNHSHSWNTSPHTIPTPSHHSHSWNTSPHTIPTPSHPNNSHSWDTHPETQPFPQAQPPPHPNHSHSWNTSPHTIPTPPYSNHSWATHPEAQPLSYTQPSPQNELSSPLNSTQKPHDNNLHLSQQVPIGQGFASDLSQFSVKRITVFWKLKGWDVEKPVQLSSGENVYNELVDKLKGEGILEGKTIKDILIYIDGKKKHLSSLQDYTKYYHLKDKDSLLIITQE